MLTKSLCLCLLALAMPHPAAPQTSPDMQKIIERLDKLEEENHQLLDEIHELRSELTAKTAAKPAAALQASKRLMKKPFIDQIKAAMKAENEEFSAQVRSEDAKEAFTAFLEKRKPDFTRTIKSPVTA